MIKIVDTRSCILRL